MASSRRQPSSASGSWRIVEGENDSFDTTLAPSLDDDFSVPSSGQPSSAFPSQLSATSQGALSMGSQDSIRDFSRHQDDPDNIMREPFRPTLPSARGTSYSGSTITARPSADLEFKMPRIDVEGAARRTTRGARMETDGGDAQLRRRDVNMLGAAYRRRTGPRAQYAEGDEQLPQTVGERMADSLPKALLEVLMWALGVITLAFRYAQRPLALLLAIYVSFGAIIVTQNIVTKSIYVSLSPICRFPGATFLNLPFCPTSPPSPSSNDSASSNLEFDDLVGAQGKLEQVLEISAEGISLPYEMKRSEMSIRDLRTLVKASEIPSRDELVHEFNSFIDVSRRSASELQRFNTHCGSAVDSVISINRWTSRYIDSLAAPNDSAGPHDFSLITRWTSWLFTPFMPTDRYFTERMILEKYVEHTAQVSDRIAILILEAQSILGLLARAEDHLALIHDVSSRNSDSVASRRKDAMWSLWTMVGGNTAHLHNLSQQESLLQKVTSQRGAAVDRVSKLMLELQRIQSDIEDLRDRVAAPELHTATGHTSIPLSVHIETIDRGIDRLEEARRRISAAETDRVREILKKVGMKDEQLIEDR
ncbi:hypothetical protein ACO1O0_004081 [Amphichorda felina]